MNESKQKNLGVALLLQLLLYCVHSIAVALIGAALGQTASLAVSCVTVCAVFILPILFYRKKAGVRLGELFTLKTVNNRTRNTSKLLLLFIFAVSMTVTAVNIIGGLCDYVFSYFTTAQTAENMSALQFVLVFLRNVLLASALEEALFRGVVLNATEGADARKRILLSALLFGLAHYSLRAFFYAFAAGIILAYFALRVGSVIFAVAMHFTQNLITFAFTVISQMIPGKVFDTVSFVAFLVFAALALTGAIYLFFDKRKASIAPVNSETQKSGVELFNGELIAFTVLAALLSIFIF